MKIFEKFEKNKNKTKQNIQKQKNNKTKTKEIRKIGPASFKVVFGQICSTF